MIARSAVVLAALGNESFDVSGKARDGAAQAGALFMLALIVLMIGLVVAFAVTMARRSRKPNVTLKFLEELNELDGDSAPAGEKRVAQPWEKPPDWWNK